MAARKKTVRRAGRRAAGTGRRTAAGGARARLAKGWDETRQALAVGGAALGERARAFARTRGVDLDKAADRLAGLGGRLDRERRKAAKRVEHRLLLLRGLAQQERGAFARRAEETVRRALVALDLPSRQELRTLTRRVEELSRRIDALQPVALPRRVPHKANKRRR